MHLGSLVPSWPDVDRPIAASQRAGTLFKTDEAAGIFQPVASPQDSQKKKGRCERLRESVLRFSMDQK